MCTEWPLQSPPAPSRTVCQMVKRQCGNCIVQEADQKLLARLAEQEAQDQHIQSARREKAKADAAWMKKVCTVFLVVT